MKNETFLAHLSPEVTPSELVIMHNHEWDNLLRRTHLVGQERREKHARRLHRSAAALFKLLLDDDLGHSRTEVVDYGDDAKRDFKTLSIPSLSSEDARHYFHIVSHLDHEDSEDLAYELFTTESRNIKMPSEGAPSKNPNYNKIGKIAGLWVVENRQSSEPDAVATLHDTHETLSSLFEVADIELPEKYYYGFQRGLKPKIRRRHR